jgi:hypothetical protein
VSSLFYVLNLEEIILLRAHKNGLYFHNKGNGIVYLQTNGVISSHCTATSQSCSSVIAGLCTFIFRRGPTRGLCVPPYPALQAHGTREPASPRTPHPALQARRNKKAIRWPRPPPEGRTGAPQRPGEAEAAPCPSQEEPKVYFRVEDFVVDTLPHTHRLLQCTLFSPPVCLPGRGSGCLGQYRKGGRRLTAAAINAVHNGVAHPCRKESGGRQEPRSLRATPYGSHSL